MTNARQVLESPTVFSGAYGEGRESRHQLQNKKAAFLKMANSKRMQAWMKLEAARRLGQLTDIEAIVDKMMDEKNIKIEYGDKYAKI